MTIEEYKKAREELLIEHTRRLNNLAKDYAMTNNTVKIGDVVTGSSVTIRVDQINYSTRGYSNEPCCIYCGPMLTKKRRTVQKWRQGADMAGVSCSVIPNK